MIQRPAVINLLLISLIIVAVVDDDAKGLVAV
jgi:hypothetical protein